MYEDYEDDEMLDAFVEETRDYNDEKFVQEMIEFQRGDFDPDDSIATEFRSPRYSIDY